MEVVIFMLSHKLARIFDKRDKQINIYMGIGTDREMNK